MLFEKLNNNDFLMVISTLTSWTSNLLSCAKFGWGAVQKLHATKGLPNALLSALAAEALAHSVFHLGLAGWHHVGYRSSLSDEERKALKEAHLKSAGVSVVQCGLFSFFGAGSRLEGTLLCVAIAGHDYWITKSRQDNESTDVSTPNRSYLPNRQRIIDRYYLFKGPAYLFKGLAPLVEGAFNEALAVLDMGRQVISWDTRLNPVRLITATAPPAVQLPQ